MPFLSDIRAMILAGVALVCLIFGAVQTIRIDGFMWIEGATDKLERVTRDNNELRFAAKEAKRLNDEQVARIEAEQQKVTDDVEANLHARLERLRSELRAKAAPRNPSGPQAGTDGKAAPGITQEAGLCLTSDQFLRAAENEERHDQLITWVEEQLKVQR